MEKAFYNKKNYIYSIVLLCVLLIISLVYNFTSGFNFTRKNYLSKEVGDSLVMTFKKEESKFDYLLIDGNRIPGDKINQSIEIILPSNSLDNYKLQLKITLDDFPIYLYGNNMWEYDEINKCYNYTGKLEEGKTLKVCDSIILNGDVHFKSDYIYSIIIFVDFIKII